MVGRVLLALFLVVVCAFLAIAVTARLVPDDPARWHVDPVRAASTGKPNEYRLLPPDAPVYEGTPEALAGAFRDVALAEPRTKLIAGSAGEREMTFVQRSRVFGFPDYVSAGFREAEGGATLAVFSRARFGKSDMGVNEARVRRWLDRLEPLEARSGAG